MATANLGIDDRLVKYIAEAFAAAPFYQLLGIELCALGPGIAELKVNIQHKHTNPLGLVHGGLVSSLADAAMGNAVRSTGRSGVTADCYVSYLTSAPQGSELQARGEVVKQGKNLVFTRANITCGDKIIAISQGTFYVIGDIQLD